MNFIDIVVLRLQIKIVPKQSQNDQIDESATKELEESGKESLLNLYKPYATPEELESGKLPPEEILSLPMFKVLSVLNNSFYIQWISNLH